MGLFESCLANAFISIFQCMKRTVVKFLLNAAVEHKFFKEKKKNTRGAFILSFLISSKIRPVAIKLRRLKMKL